MKRLFIYCLMVINLLAGTGLAWDSHPESVAGDDTELVRVVAGQAQIDAHDHYHYEDRCGHASAHMIGVFFVPNFPGVVLSSIEHPGPQHPVSSFDSMPLLRPPIA